MNQLFRLGLRNLCQLLLLASRTFPFLESGHDLLFSSEDEALEYSGSDSEIVSMSEEESSDDDNLALARQWF